MKFQTKQDFSLEEYNRVIERYKFPITDLGTAVQFLNELPKNCNVDLAGGIKHGMLHKATAIDGEYNLLLECHDSCLDTNYFRVHAILEKIYIGRVKDDHHNFVIICSGSKKTDTDLYFANDFVVLNPTTSDVYDMLYPQIMK